MPAGVGTVENYKEISLMKEDETTKKHLNELASLKHNILKKDMEQSIEN